MDGTLSVRGDRGSVVTGRLQRQGTTNECGTMWCTCRSNDDGVVSGEHKGIHSASHTIQYNYLNIPIQNKKIRISLLYQIPIQLFLTLSIHNTIILYFHKLQYTFTNSDATITLKMNFYFGTNERN
jgi:hypothetical protein